MKTIINLQQTAKSFLLTGAFLLATTSTLGAVLTVTANTAIAQDYDYSVNMEERHSEKPSKHHNKKMSIKHLKKQLDLTEEQVSAIKEIRKNAKENAPQNNHKAKIKQSIASLDPRSSNYLSEVEALADKKSAHIKSKMLRRAETHMAIFEVLTPEQQEKFLVLKRKHIAKNKN